MLKNRIIAINGNIATFNIDKKKRFLIVFFIGILLGTFIINLLNDYLYERLFNYRELVENINSSINLDKSLLFKYEVKRLLPVGIVLLIICFFRYRNLFLGIYIMYFGIRLSMLLCIDVLDYGIKGMAIFCLSIFPQIIVEIIYLIRLINFYSNINEYRYNKEYKIIYANILWILLLVILNAFMQAYINSEIINALIMLQKR